MSNLTTLPKGDSAWLLRRSIQRIMQQVSVLETNIGASTTANSANTQVIFNDNGTLRGDAGFTYNAATDTLSVGSATITGNLTVDTNTLFVDAVNNRVGIGTVTPSQRFSIERAGVGSETSVLISRSSTNYLDEQAIVWRSNDLSNLDYAGIYAAVDGADAGSLSFRTASLSTLTNRFRIASDGVATWSNVGGVAGTAMTLNSTGLGLGVTPSAGKGALQLSSGINFPATQVASSDANTLDDYEEGTFTPTVVGGTTSGTASYSTQVGFYTKVGRLVTFNLRVIYTGGTGTGTLRVAGLPFATSQIAIYTVYLENIALTAGNYPVTSSASGATSIGIEQVPTGGGAVTSVTYDVAGDIQISGSYIA